MLGLVWCGSKARFAAVANLTPENRTVTHKGRKRVAAHQGAQSTDVW